MITNATQYTRLVFWLKLMLGLSAILLFFVIFVFSYYKEEDTSFKVITKDVRIGLKFQARDTHITGSTSDGGTFDFHAKALNPSHQNDKTVILSKPLGKIAFSSEQTYDFSSDFASFNLDKKNIFFNGNLIIKSSRGTIIKTEELIADFERKLLVGPKKTLVETEIGYLVSGGMEISYGSNIEENIFLKNGVELEIYVE
ncbi:MAG: LPS export ABC transporter periplasmic protein LptC [Paracoccaceae bacterium]